MIVLIILAVLIFLAFLLVFVVPFFIPIHPLKDTVDPHQLADDKSRFVEVNGLSIHYKQMGRGEPNFILLHGLGAYLFTWHRVMDDLTQFGTVTAYDRPGFGLTERPLPNEFDGRNPYSRIYQPELLDAVMKKLGIQSAVLIGNSAGGTVSVQMALRYPDRVKALILVDPALITLGGPPIYLDPLYKLPSIDRIGPLFARRAAENAQQMLDRTFHDPSKDTEAMLEGYEIPLRAKNWDWALWEFIKSAEPIDLKSHLSEIKKPVLFITGDDDHVIATDETIRAAGLVPDAKLVVIPNCGHVPQEERPDEFMVAVTDFIHDLKIG